MSEVHIHTLVLASRTTIVQSIANLTRRKQYQRVIIKEAL